MLTIVVSSTLCKSSCKIRFWSRNHETRSIKQLHLRGKLVGILPVKSVHHPCDAASVCRSKILIFCFPYCAFADVYSERSYIKVTPGVCLCDIQRGCACAKNVSWFCLRIKFWKHNACPGVRFFYQGKPELRIVYITCPIHSGKRHMVTYFALTMRLTS